MAKRRFKMVGGEWTEVTPDAERKVCDQISKGVDPYHEPLEFKLPRRRKASLWPRESWQCGVDPSEVAAAEKAAADRGVPTEFNKDTGDAIFRDQNHEKRYCKAFGYFNRNAGYGDAAPDHYVESTHGEKVVQQKRREYHESVKQQIAQLEREIFG